MQTLEHYATITAITEPMPGKVLTLYHMLPNDETEAILSIVVHEPLADHVIETLADTLCRINTTFLCEGCDALATKLNSFGYGSHRSITDKGE